jgi:hypothetical protein
MDNIMHGDNNTTKKGCLLDDNFHDTCDGNHLPHIRVSIVVVVVQQLCLACKSSGNYFCPMCFGRARKKKKKICPCASVGSKKKKKNFAILFRWGKKKKKKKKKKP